MDVGALKRRFGVVGTAPALNRALSVAAQVATTDISVLVLGESGTGKEVMPRIVHQFSARKHGPYVAVNCGAIPEGTIDSELFGHEKGAFTGAVSKALGKFVEADGGTLFLDEVGELPLDAQVKLLRALQEGEVDAVGSRRPTKVDVRIISATNRDLSQQVADGTFREDLFYRLNVVPVTIPSLAERRDDIPALATHFFARYAAEQGLPPPEVSEEALATLQAYDWPGNIRELRNVLERALTMSEDGDLLDADAIFKVLPRAGQRLVSPVPARSVRPLARIVAEAEAQAIEEALVTCRGNRTKAARLLGISRSVLYEKLARLS